MELHQFHQMPLKAFFAHFLKTFPLKFLFGLVVFSIYFGLIYALFIQLFPNDIRDNFISEFQKILPKNNDVLNQSELINFTLKYPQISNLVLIAFVTLLFFIAIFFSIAYPISLSKGINQPISFQILNAKKVFKILTFLVFIFTSLMAYSIILMLLASILPILGIIMFLVFLVLVNRLSLIPNSILFGNLDFVESLKFSWESITFKRALVSTIFGLSTYFMLMAIINLVFIFCIKYFDFHFLNIIKPGIEIIILLVIYVTGSTCMFFRYGHFDLEES